MTPDVNTITRDEWSQLRRRAWKYQMIRRGSMEPFRRAHRPDKAKTN